MSASIMIVCLEDKSYVSINNKLLEIDEMNTKTKALYAGEASCGVPLSKHAEEIVKLLSYNFIELTKELAVKIIDLIFKYNDDEFINEKETIKYLITHIGKHIKLENW